MPRSRSTWPLRFAGTAIGALAAAGLAACSGSGPGGDTPGDGGTLPGFDAPPPQGLFPLRVSSDGASLTSDDGKPFLLHGEAAWSLIVQLTTNDAMRYLADRHARGVNTLIVNLIEHFYADHPPSNAAGDAPFTKAGDFAAPNEAYFAHADTVIDLAASQGMAVLLTPSYLGIHGGDEGWFQEMSAMQMQSPTSCGGYGNFVGRRYAAKPNVLWLWGGDYTPPTGSPGETCMKAISDAILAAMPANRTVRASAHWDMETTSRDEPAFTKSIDTVAVYTYNLALPACRLARSAAPRMPTYLIETCYEDEPFGRCPSHSDVRRQQWWAFLGCGAGEIYGVEGIWQFDNRWSQKLGSPVSVGEQRLLAIAQQVAWQTLELDDALVTSGRGAAGSSAEAAVARTADHTQALIYVPPDGGSTITVDLTQMITPVSAIWQDPTADHSVAAGNGLTGSHTFNLPPGNNNGGDSDWVLVLQAQ
jgi:hypothetical protein